MSEEILATEIDLARDEMLTETEVRELIRTGRKRRLKKAPEVVITTTAEGPVVAVEAPALPEPEVPRDPWEGFSSQSRSLISHFEGLRESHVLDSSVRRLIDMTADAQSVEDFAEFTDSTLASFIDTLRNRLSSVHREMNDFMNRINTARTMAVDVDFI